MESILWVKEERKGEINYFFLTEPGNKLQRDNRERDHSVRDNREI